MRERWIQVDPFGILCFENVLIYLNEPDLFVCTDEYGRRYLAVFLDEEKEKYLLVETDHRSILQMIDGKISMVQAFQSAKDGKAFYVFYDTNANQFALREEAISQVPKEDFPKENAFFTLDDDHVQKYRKFLQKQVKS